jgi:hypothetical protein
MLTKNLIFIKGIFKDKGKIKDKQKVRGFILEHMP